MARDDFGTFFVTWQAENPVTGFYEVFAQRYDNVGKPLGEVFAVSGPAEGQQAEPSLTADTQGNVTVAWIRYSLEDEPAIIELQAYSSSGEQLGETIDIPPLPGDQPMSSLVQSDGEGNLWVAWTGESLDGSGGGVYAQKVSRGGALIGQPVKVNTIRNAVRRIVVLWVERNGSFRVVWEGLGPGGGGRGLRERKFDGTGRPLGEEASINSLN
jgi:hypothetical protein